MMFGLVRRAFGLVVLLFAAYAFVMVPIGRRTAYGHLAAIFSTEPAREAAKDLQKTGIDLGSRLLDQGTNRRPAPPNRH